MAGFDFEVEISGSQRFLVRALLRELQAFARARGVSVRFRTNAVGYHVDVNGSLFETQAIVETSRPFLVGFATGLPRPRGRRTRCSICERVLESFVSSVSEISTLVDQASDLFDGVPYSYRFDIGDATDLAGSMKAFSRVLVLYHNGHLAPVHLAESAHTAIETLLRRALGRDSRGKSFEAMAHRAVKRGYLTAESVGSILELKNIRRDAKHRGQGIRPQKLERLLEPILRGCHELTRAMRRERRPEQTSRPLPGVEHHASAAGASRCSDPAAEHERSATDRSERRKTSRAKLGAKA